MTSSTRVSVDAGAQAGARGQSATDLAGLAEGLPTLSGAGIKAEHFAAAKSLLDRARSALKAASTTNTTTGEAATALGGQDHMNGQRFDGVRGV